MARLKAFALLLLSIFLIRGFLLSQQQEISSQEIRVVANYWDKNKEQITAQGDVEIHYKDITLLADKVKVNAETKDVQAWGNVTIRLPEEVVSCEEVKFNLDSSEGEMIQAFGLIKPTIFYQAESIKRKNENLYSLKKAKITSCTQPVPRWRFSCSRANLKKDKYMEMWNAVFRIKKIPVLYLPYMRYPLDKERSTGFLMPQLGYSGQKGVYFSQDFFWAIRRNMDATLNLDYYLDRGWGGGLEYRYLFSEGTGGQLNLYYFRFNRRAPVGSPEKAYLVRVKHNQSLPLDFHIVADVDYQSSYDFLREFDNNFRRAVVSNRRSQVYLSRAWSSFNFNVRVSRFETYFRQLDDSIIRKNYPQIGFSSSKIKVFSPLYFSFSSMFDSWEYGWETAYETGKQKYSKSLSFSPVLTIPFTSIPWLTLNSSLSAHFNYYFQSYSPGTKAIVDEPILSHNYSVNFEFIGPVFYKIYYDAKDEPKLKHVIEPNFSYRYESPVGLSDRIITQRFFYINHYARYGLTNRFFVKKNGMPREILSLGLSQIFYFSPEDSPLRPYTVDGEIPQFSDINGTLRFYPAARYSLDFSAAFNPYYRTFSRLRLGANFGSPRDSLFLRVNWYKSVNPYRETSLLARHQVGFFCGAKIPSLSLETQVEIDFNIIEREMLYSAFALVYHYQCVDFRGELKIFYFRDKPEARFMFSFGLGNIGKTTDFLGGMGF
jgi:lipopolysaccharide assembly outer membrane protein LptD (OstA)